MSRSTYEYWLGFMKFPLPPKHKNTKSSNNKRYITINDGENTTSGNPKLEVIELEAIFPHTTYPATDRIIKTVSKSIENNLHLSDQSFLKYIQGLLVSGDPVQFIIIRILPNGISLFNTNVTVIVDEVDFTEEIGYDITARIKLIQKKVEQTRTLTSFGDHYIEEITSRLPPITPTMATYYTAMNQTLSGALPYIQRENPDIVVSEEILQEKNPELFKKYGMNDELPRGTKINVGNKKNTK